MTHAQRWKGLAKDYRAHIDCGVRGGICGVAVAYGTSGDVNDILLCRWHAVIEWRKEYKRGVRSMHPEALHDVIDAAIALRDAKLDMNAAIQRGELPSVDALTAADNRLFDALLRLGE